MAKVTQRVGSWPPKQPCTKCGAVHVLTWPCPSGVVAANKAKKLEAAR